MSDETSGTAERDDELARLLGRAERRQRPRQSAEAAAFASLHAEWHAMVARRRKRKFGVLAAAAAVAAAIAIAFGVRLGFVAPPGAPVATIERLEGARVSADGGAVDERPAAGGFVRVGQELTTGPGSRLALAWRSGGSLRVNERTRMVLESPSAVRVLTGAVYFDSAEAGGAVSIRTPAGDVRHVGTQFMLDVRDDDVTLSVREGRVQVTGNGFEVTIDSGEQIEIDGSGVLGRRMVAGHDPAWSWAASIAPQPDLDGASAFAILAWAARETGRRLAYDGPTSEQAAHATIVRGVERRSPAGMLALLPLLTELTVEVRDEVIVVSAR